MDLEADRHTEDGAIGGISPGQFTDPKTPMNVDRYVHIGWCQYANYNNMLIIPCKPNFVIRIMSQIVSAIGGGVKFAV